MQVSKDGRGPGQWGSQRGFLDNEHAIWMGDLNYRLTIPDEQVLFPQPSSGTHSLWMPAKLQP